MSDSSFHFRRNGAPIESTLRSSMTNGARCGLSTSARALARLHFYWRRTQNGTHGAMTTAATKALVRGSGEVKPYYGSLSDGFGWDGSVVKPYYGSLSDGWSFDGKVLKPYYGSLSDGWSWDGDVLKPYYGSLSDAYQISSDGTIKPYYGSLSDAFQINGDVCKPYYGSLSDGWQISGDVPRPVVAAIALGIIKHK